MSLSTMLIIIPIVVVLILGAIHVIRRVRYVSKNYYTNIIDKKDKLHSIEKDELHNIIVEETKQRSSYQKRCLELEDAIKEGVGVSLRNEITRVNCIFDEHEMNAILEASRYLVKEYYKSTDALRFYLKLIEKIEQNLSLMIKEKENKLQE